MKNPFLTHPNLKEVHQTSDGTFFYTPNAAANHARGLEDKTVTTFTPDNFKPKAGKTVALEADKAEKEAAEKASSNNAGTEGSGENPPKIYTKEELEPKKRFELDAIAVALGFDSTELPNKNAVIAAIVEFQSK